MQIRSVDQYCCPDCKKGDLFLETSPSREGKLLCQICGKGYPVIDGIPRFVDMDNYSESFGYQWNLHYQTQLDSYTGLPISRKRLYAATGWKAGFGPAQRILEAGSGAGRFTEVLLNTGMEIYSFDYSRAVEANFKNHGKSSRLNLFQGNIFNIPLSDGSFGHVLCLGVIQHTPDPQKAFISLADKVKPGGSLYIDVYTRSWHHWLQWKYILRPLTKRIGKERLYRFLERAVPACIYPAQFFKKYLGKIGSRLAPIVEYSALGLPKKLNREWAILDTFDMYSPVHDHPQSLSTVQRWFKEAGFTDIQVWYGDNGVVGRGRKREA